MHIFGIIISTDIVINIIINFSHLEPKDTRKMVFLCGLWNEIILTQNKMN